jgi:uncharacterized protein (UPF0332 family)
MKKDDAIAELIHYRMQQAETTVADAHCLLNGNGSPQSVINRSYYAMFYAALALMLRIGKTFSKHSGVIGAFDKEFIHKGLLPKELSVDLHKAFELRQEHDYRTIAEPASEEAEATLRKAERFVSAVRQFLAKP